MDTPARKRVSYFYDRTSLNLNRAVSASFATRTKEELLITLVLHPLPNTKRVAPYLTLSDAFLQCFLDSPRSDGTLA